MITLVIGGSGSGKSAYAEELLKSYTENKFYLATMKRYTKEDDLKINRHRELRRGKGFTTLEFPVDIESASSCVNGESVILLECVTNLVANEMFKNEIPLDADVVCDKVYEAIIQIGEKVRELVVVTGNVAEDGASYDEYTLEYIKAISMVNEKLAESSERVAEVVAGIPTEVKGMTSVCAATEDRGMGIRLFIGGCGQDKYKYVAGKYPDYTNRIVDDFQEWIKDKVKSHADVIAETKRFINEHKDALIICDEVGNGIVPIDDFEREYRETVGRVLEYVASQAISVERIICGIGQVLK